VDILEIDIVTGKRTSFAVQARKALRALKKSDVPFAVIGATALAARGLPRMTRDLDVVVTTDDAWVAIGRRAGSTPALSPFESIDALEEAGFSSVASLDRSKEAEAMYVLTAGSSEVDLLVASGEPESTVVAEATEASVFGVRVPVATLEQLVLMYLYSNQVRHQGDLARIVTDTDVELAAVERYLADVHPEMLPVLRERVHAARNPPAPPPRPKRRRSR
jgi:hypothetical protein